MAITWSDIQRQNEINRKGSEHPHGYLEFKLPEEVDSQYERSPDIIPLATKIFTITEEVWIDKMLEACAVSPKMLGRDES